MDKKGEGTLSASANFSHNKYIYHCFHMADCINICKIKKKFTTNIGAAGEIYHLNTWVDQGK